MVIHDLHALGAPGNLGNLLSISSVYQISMIYSWLRPFIMIINDLYLLVIMSTTFISRSTNSTRFEVLLAFTEAQLKRGPDLLKVGPKSRREGSKVAEPGYWAFFLERFWGIFTSIPREACFLRLSVMRILTWEFWGTGRNHTPKKRSNLPNELELKNHNVSQSGRDSPLEPWEFAVGLNALLVELCTGETSTFEAVHARWSHCLDSLLWLDKESSEYRSDIFCFCFLVMNLLCCLKACSTTWRLCEFEIPGVCTGLRHMLVKS